MIEKEPHELELLEQFSAAQNENELADLVSKAYPDLSTITDASKDEFIAQFLPYIGGKYRQAKFIQANLPNLSFDTYVSVFGGMMWDFLRLKPDSFSVQHVVYNDINQLNTNLFRCVINQRFHELYKVIKDIPNNEPERFKQYQEEIYSPALVLNNEPNFDIAMKYAYVLTNVFSGLAPATAKFVKGKEGFETFKKKLDINNTRHANLRRNIGRINEVVQMDFADVISRYNSGSTFFFVDPPYVGTEDYYSNSKFNYNDHTRLRASLDTVEGKFQLCYYETDLLSKLYTDKKFFWVKKDFVVGSSSAKKKNKKPEVIVTNYDRAQILDENINNILST